LDPEILVVDEVLAVGDAEFQQKAIGKMQDVSRGEGRTVLFVSHNMASLQNLCTKGLLLENGTSTFSGTINQTIDKYLSTRLLKFTNVLDRFNGQQRPLAYFTDAYFLDDNGTRIDNVLCGSKMNIVACYHSDLNQPIVVNIGIYNAISDKILHLSTEYTGKTPAFPPKDGKVVFSFEKFPLPEGTYTLNFTIWSGMQRHDWLKDTITLNVIEADFYGSGRIPPASDNKVLIDYNWKMETL
jgi:lipopolysaccharide transport system ATP-binding protein